MQTHSTRSGRTPEIEISTRSERLILQTKAGDRWSIPLQRGVWHDSMLRVEFSSSPSEGFVELWHNGRKVVTGHRTATLASGVDSYLKLGLYRSSKIKATGVVYHDGLRVGGTYEAAEVR